MGKAVRLFDLQFKWRVSPATHAQGFPLLLKDAASSYWPSVENEQCTAA